MIVWKILMFILCLNITCMVINNTFPMLAYTVSTNTTIYDVNQLVTSWNPVITSIPLIGDIVTGTLVFFNLFKSVIWGFTDLLEQVGVDTSIVWGIRVLFSVVLCMTFIQLISGRPVEE